MCVCVSLRLWSRGRLLFDCFATRTCLSDSEALHKKGTANYLQKNGTLSTSSKSETFQLQFACGMSFGGRELDESWDLRCIILNLLNTFRKLMHSKMCLIKYWAFAHLFGSHCTLFLKQINYFSYLVVWNQMMIWIWAKDTFHFSTNLFCGSVYFAVLSYFAVLRIHLMFNFLVQVLSYF